MSFDRRSFLQTSAALVAASGAAQSAFAQFAPGPAPEAEDRVFICNEDSNTLSVIDPRTNTIETAVNLTSFDEDPRPPFRFVTGGVAPTHAGMIQDRKSTRLNSSHANISYAVFCLKKKKKYE